MCRLEIRPEGTMNAAASLNRLRIKRTESMLTVLGVPDVPGIAAGLFSAFAQRGLPVTMIVQNAPDAGSASITFTVYKKDLDPAMDITRGLVEKIGAEGIMNDERIARLSVAGGVALEDTVGLAGEFFSILASERINVLAINSTADVISCIIEDANVDKAASLLANKFGLVVESAD